MAGTRTNALVAARASSFVMAGALLEHDPSAACRIASYMVSGVGFLGAGVIFKDGASVRGLNTAASSDRCSQRLRVLATRAALSRRRAVYKHRAAPAGISPSSSATRG